MRRNKTSGSRHFGEDSVMNELISPKKALPLVSMKDFHGAERFERDSIAAPLHKPGRSVAPKRRKKIIRCLCQHQTISQTPAGVPICRRALRTHRIQ